MPEVNTTAKKTAKPTADALTSVTDIASQVAREGANVARSTADAVTSTVHNAASMAQTATAQAADTTAQTADAAGRQTAEAMRQATSGGFASFEMSRMEVPAAYRDLAERSLSQAKQNYDRARSAAEQASDMLETSVNAATKGVSEYTQRVMEAMRANVSANFDFTKNMLGAKSPSEALELSTAHARKQFEAITQQGKDLAALAQKLSAEAVEPIRSGMDKALRSGQGS